MWYQKFKAARNSVAEQIEALSPFTAAKDLHDMENTDRNFRDENTVKYILRVLDETTVISRGLGLTIKARYARKGFYVMVCEGPSKEGITVPLEEWETHNEKIANAIKAVPDDFGVYPEKDADKDNEY